MSRFPRRKHYENIWATDFGKQRIKEVKLEKYGNENYNNREKYKKTCLEKYGSDNIFSSQYGKQKIIETNIRKTGFEHQNKTLENRKRISNMMSSTEIQLKINSTKKKNNSFNISKTEEICFKILNEVFPNIIRQYRSEKYPFNCDFYIPEKDLYIEFNGTWTHGKHPFDINNKNDIDLVEMWKSKNTKFYQNAIETWTKRDVLKREAAKNNNVNFIEFWNLDEVKKWINSIILL